MKRSRITSALFGALLTGMALFSGMRASAAAPEIEVKWIGESPAYTAVATWTYEGEQYEMAVTGLKSKLSEAKLMEPVKAFHAGQDAELTDPALTDAEKFSHLIPHRAGDESTWVVKDKVRKEGAWGDSLQCWAASTGNMIASSGWAAAAKDPETGETFPDEDAVFSYLTECFRNDGNYQDAGVRWFFTGKAGDILGLRKENGKKLIEDSPKPYLKAVYADDCGSLACSVIAGMAQEIKKGAALGISISFSSASYPLIEDPDVMVTEEEGRYYEFAFAVFDEEEYLELPEHYWTFAADGGVIVLEKTGEEYRDENGRAYPVMSVKKDHLFQEAETGAWLIPEPEKSGLSYTVTWNIEHAPEEVDLTKPVVPYLTGNGSHAVTVSGYIKNVTKANDGMKGLRALLIADSDNDANIWQIDENTTKKEERPNTYTLCYAEKRRAFDTVTLNLTNYVKNGSACIAYACLLYPKENTPKPDPVPQTGDGNRAGLCTAALLLSAAGFYVSFKKRVRE